MRKLVWQERHDEDLKWEVEAVLAWHDEDARAAIATLLLDCQHLRLQLALTQDADSCVSARRQASATRTR